MLGDTHNDTVVTVYNLAELHSAMGNKELATELQEALVTTLQGRDGASSGAQPQAQAQQHPQAQAYQDGQQQQREDSSTPVLTQERSILRGRLDVNLYKNSSSSGGGNPPPLTATGQEKINIADIIARDLASDSAVHQNNNSSSINSNSATGAATTPTGAAGTGAAVGAGEEVKKTPPQTFASRMNKPATRRKPAAAIP